jgi:hypothetical protein
MSITVIGRGNVGGGLRHGPLRREQSLGGPVFLRIARPGEL